MISTIQTNLTKHCAGRVSIIVLLSLMCVNLSVNAATLKQKFDYEYSGLKSAHKSYEQHKVKMSKDRYNLKVQKAELSRLKRLSQEASDTLVKLQRAEEQFVEINFDSQISEQRKERKKAKKLYFNQKNSYKRAQETVRGNATKLNAVVDGLESRQRSTRRLVDLMVEKDIARQLSGMQIARRIKVAATQTCSISITKDDCREKAKIKAQRMASEKGAVVVVSSMTEMKNFKLINDRVKSSVKSRISDIKILKDSYDSTADKSGWFVEYSISALVTPVVTSEMKNELHSQAVLKLNVNKSLFEPVKSSRTVAKAQKYHPKTATSRPVVSSKKYSLDDEDDLMEGWSKSAQRYQKAKR